MPFPSGLDKLDWPCKPQTLSLKEGRAPFSGPERLSFCGSDKITVLLNRQCSDFPRNHRSQAPALLAVGSPLRIRL